MDFTKKQKFIGGGSIIAIISAFLNWFIYDMGVMGSASINGLTSWYTLSFVAALLLLGSLTPQAKDIVAQLKDNERVIQLSLAAVIAGIPVLALISGPTGTGIGVSPSPSIGLFGAIAGGAIALFGLLKVNGKENKKKEEQQELNKE